MGKIVVHTIVFLLWCMALLPLGCLYVISDIIYVFVYHVAGYRKPIVRMNLQNAFPDKNMSEIVAIEKAFYHHLCDCIVETIKLLHISDEEMSERIVFEGGNIIEQAVREGHPVFLLIGHLGNWEWIQEIGKRVSNPTEFGFVYHKMKTGIADEVMIRIRSRYSMLQIPQANAVRTMIDLKRKNNTYMVGFIADQRPMTLVNQHWIEFLHQDTNYMVGPEVIGKHVEAKLVYLSFIRTSRGNYLMKITDMLLSEQNQLEYPYMALYYKLLEQDICNHPEQWLWSHNRWKIKRNKDSNN